MSLALLLRVTLVAHIAALPLAGCVAQDSSRSSSATAEGMPFFVPGGARGVSVSVETDLVEYSFEMQQAFPAAGLESELRVRFGKKGWIANDATSKPFEYFAAGGESEQGSLVRFLSFVREGCYGEVALIYQALREQESPRVVADRLTVSVKIAKTTQARTSRSVRQLCL